MHNRSYFVLVSRLNFVPWLWVVLAIPSLRNTIKENKTVQRFGHPENMHVNTQTQKAPKIFLEPDRHLRDIRVFQSQSAQVKNAHGCSTTDEDEEGDELAGKE